MNIVTVKVNDYEIKIQLKNLDKQMDDCLSKLMVDFFQSENHLFRAINQNLMQNFEKDVFDYLDRRYLDNQEDLFTLQDFLFNNLTVISKQYIELRLYRDAEEFWIRILDIVNKWEDSRKLRVHKGSIYYFWAEIALFTNEVDKGFFLIHKAYLEDCETHGGNTPGTPAYKTVTLNMEDKENMLYGYVLELWDFLGTCISNYNKEHNRTLTKEQIYSKFISNPPSPDILFSFAHSLARINQLMKFHFNITQSSFAGLYELNILFDLTLIIDNLYYSKIPVPKIRKEWGFGKILKQLLIDSHMEKSEDPINQNLKAINDSIENNFDATIKSLYDKTFQFPASANINPLYYEIS